MSASRAAGPTATERPCDGCTSGATSSSPLAGYRGGAARPRGAAARPQARERPRLDHPHRSVRAVDGLSDLARGHPEPVTEQQDLLLAPRKSADQPHEAVAVARGRILGDRGVTAPQKGVGLLHARPACPAEVVQGSVAGDEEQPALERARWVVPMQRGERVHEDVLGDVARVVRVAAMGADVTLYASE